MSVVSDFFADMDLREAKSQAQSSSQQQEQEVAGSLLDICYKGTRGTSILRPIMASNNIPVRNIDDVYDLYETFPLLDAEGKQRTGEDGRGWVTTKHTFVMATPNYRIQLTPDQISLQNALIKAIKDYNSLVQEEIIDPDNLDHGITTKLRVNPRWKITMFWAKVLSLTVPGEGCTISDGEVRLIRHHGSSFRQDMNNAVKGRTQMKGGDGSWQDAFWNRNLGPATAVMSINVTQQQGFKNTIQFEDFGPQYTITDKDLETAGDLFAVGDSPARPWIVGLNAMAYPHTEMQDAYNRITQYLNAFKARAGNTVIMSGSIPQAQSAPTPAGIPTQVAPSAPPPQAQPVYTAPANVGVPYTPAPPPPVPPTPQAQPVYAQPVQPQAPVQPIGQPGPVYQQPPQGQPVQPQPVAQPIYQASVGQPVAQAPTI